MGNGKPGVAKRRWGVYLLVLILIALLGFPTPTFAQAVKGTIESVGIGGSKGQGGVYRAGSWVPVQVRLKNRSGAKFEGRLAVEQKDLDGDKILSIGPKFILLPGDTGDADDEGGRLIWTYFWPRPDEGELHGIDSVVVLDDRGGVISKVSTPTGQSSNYGIGSRDYEGNRSSRFVVILGSKDIGWNNFRGAWGGTEAVESVWVKSADKLPDDVKGLDGVDVIVWQADGVKPFEVPAEFQLKAMLEWVRAGGHLIVSVGTQGQEFLKGGSSLLDAMPLTITATRQIRLADLESFPGCVNLRGSNQPLIQAVGDLKPGARPVAGATVGEFSKNPLAVTGLYGRGAITMLTVDASALDILNEEGKQKLDEKNWMKFWSQVAGWQAARDFVTQNESRGQDADQKIDRAAVEFPIGTDIPKAIDVSEVTAVRILVAVLFLAIYWLLAGPIGHLIMRNYKVVHWSWWIFGGTVLVATAVAGVVVLWLHVTTYDVRHKTFVLGTVNSDQVTVAGYYGIYAPSSGAIELKLGDEEHNADSSLNYLVPMCFPMTEDVKPYADPQSYELAVDHPAVVSPVFRSTLKKMQARWSGRLPGITGSAQYESDALKPLSGSLTNNTGYDLEDVQIVAHFPPREGENNVGPSVLFRFIKTWKTGETVDLRQFERELMNQTFTGWATLDNWLGAMVLRQSPARHGFGGGLSQEQLNLMGNGLKEVVESGRDFSNTDLLYFLLDVRPIDNLAKYHHEVIRGPGRLTDCTKALHAAGGLIVARAGNMNRDFVRNPVPLSVNGNQVPGKGEILFAWALPLSGTPAPLQNQQIRPGGSLLQEAK